MKASCPRCGRGTEIDNDLGDFPVRCQKCGALLRRNSKRDDPADAQSSISAERNPEVRRIERGTLAGLLIARATSEEFAPAVIHGLSASSSAADFSNNSIRSLASAIISPRAAPEPATSAPSSVLRPESRKEIARAAARQKALRQAELRASLQSFSALSWAGLTLIALLLVGVMILKVEAMWRHPAPAHADTLRVGQ